MKKVDPVTKAAFALIEALIEASGPERWGDWKPSAEPGFFSNVHEERDDAQGAYRLVTSDGKAVVTANLDSLR